MVLILRTGVAAACKPMMWRYEYTPYIWPMLGATGFVAMLAMCAWWRRSIPGALPFSLLMAFAFLWSAGAVLELAAAELSLKIFWVKFQAAWQLPVITAELWFALEYANLSRWLNGRVLVLAAIPPVLLFVLVLTNDAHHIAWQALSSARYVRPVTGTAGRILLGYGLALAFASSLVFLWLFVRSPLHRKAAALCFLGQVATRMAFLRDASGANPLAPLNLTICAGVFTATMYAFALFRFRMFDLLPIARGTMIEQMREAMVVLDAQRRIIDLNPAAEKILGISAARARGTKALQILPASPELSVSLAGPGELQSEITIATRDSTRHFALHVSPLVHRGGFPLGRLILLHDVTEQKRAQAQILEQQRALATLEERDRVARELHDSLGQVLGYVKMQAHAARELLARGKVVEADSSLAQLAAVAQDAHTDVREYILSARTGIPAASAFLPTLEGYLRRFSESYAIATQLIAAPELTDYAFEPMVATQLLRIIQETLTNVRKHSGAHLVNVRFALTDNHAEAIVQDNGVGFDPALMDTDAGQKFGLRFMRERAQEVGGSVQVHSVPGEGTQIVICVPLRKGQS